MATGLTHDQTPTLTRFMGAWGSAAPSLGASSEPESFISKTMFPVGRVVGRMALVLSYCLSNPTYPDAPRTEPGGKRCQKEGEDVGGP